MKFSNSFKVWWWASILIILTGISVWRLCLNSFTGGDIFIFLFWFILVLFPIISEISLFGINVKKDIEQAKSEIKGYIAEIKNQINFQPTINVTTAPANKKEYEKKAKDEVREEVKVEKNSSEKRAEDVFSTSQDTSENKISENQKVQDRLNKILIIEKLIEGVLKKSFGENYKSKIKITNTNSEKSIIADGVVYKEDASISELIEVKFITRLSFDRFYYIALNHLKKIFKFGLRIPVRFIVVSEDIDQESAEILMEQIIKINYQRTLHHHVPHTNIQVFNFRDGNITELTKQ